MRLADCHNIADFRELARRRLPWPVFDYIDGAADDERTRARNTAAFDDCALIPDVLAGIDEVGRVCAAGIGEIADADAERGRGEHRLEPGLAVPPGLLGVRPRPDR